MKKSILSLGLMLAALTLTNCSQNEEFTSTFVNDTATTEIYTDIETRTANDGALGTDWVKGDALNVFYAEANQTSYTSAGQFSIAEADVATGRFTGTLTEALDATKAYDWYAFYPYNEMIVTPANTSAGYTYIGGRSDRAQKQTGNSNMNHVCGSNYPLCGLVKGVAANEAPVLKMKQVACLVEVKVTNGLSEALTVSSVALQATEDIQGSYFIDFSDEVVAFKSSGDTYVTDTALLEVASGEEIAAGASATFYFAVKPFSAAPGDVLTLTVGGTTESGAGEHVATLELEDEALFEAGTIKTLNVTYSTAVEVLEKETWSLVTLPTEITEGTYVILTKNANTGAISYMVNTTSTAGPLQTPTSAFDCTTAEVKTHLVTEDMRWNFAGTTSAMTITNAAGKYLYATTSNNGLRVGDTKDTWTIATHTKNSAAFSFRAASTENRYITAYQASNWRCYKTEYAAAEYEEGSTAGQNGEVYLYMLGTIDRTPTLSVAETTIEDVHANGVEATFPVIAANLTEGVTVTFDGTVVKNATFADGHVSYTVAENEGAAREGWIKLTSGSLEATVTVKQNAVVLAKTLPYTESFATSLGDFSINNVNLGTLSAIWSHDASYKCAIASGYGGAVGNEAWLVSPTIDLTSASSPLLSFDHAKGYSNSGDEERCTVWIKKEGGEFTQLTIPAAYPNSWSFITSGDISLKEYVGSKVVIGFKYILVGNSSNAPKWEIQNFSVEDRKATQTISFAEGSLSAVLGETVTGLTVSGAQTTVTYTSSNEAVAKVDAATGALTLVGEGNTTITATAAESDEFSSATATYVLKVTATAVEEVEATLSFGSTANRVSQTTSQQVWTANGVTLTNDKDKSTSNVGNFSNPARFYKSSKITITADGNNISKIVFNCNNTTYATSLKNSIGADATVSGKVVTVVFGTAVTSYSASLTDGQVQVDSIVVTISK